MLKPRSSHNVIKQFDMKQTEFEPTFPLLFPNLTSASRASTSRQQDGGEDNTVDTAASRENRTSSQRRTRQGMVAEFGMEISRKRVIEN